MPPSQTGVGRNHLTHGRELDPRPTLPAGVKHRNIAGKGCPDQTDRILSVGIQDAFADAAHPDSRIVPARGRAANLGAHMNGHTGLSGQQFQIKQVAILAGKLDHPFYFNPAVIVRKIQWLTRNHWQRLRKFPLAKNFKARIF